MGKIDDLRSRYYKINKITFQRIVQGDNTPTKKYLEYMLKIWETKSDFLTIDMLIKKVTMFDDLLPFIENKDIYSRVYKDFNYLSDVVNTAQAKKDDNQYARDEHVDVLVENDSYILVSPKTYEGSLKYGANTKWCTAATSTDQSFRDYTRTGILCYLIDKSHKIQKNHEKVGIYISSIDEILITNAKMYNVLDAEVTTRTLVSVGWSLEDLVLILTKVRVYGVERSLVKKAEENIKNAIKTISTFNVDEIFKSIKYIESQDTINLDDEKNTINQFIEELKNKLSQF